MIYFDHHAATAPVKEVLTAMREAEAFAWANPSSIHAAGQKARALLDEARRRVAASVGADANEIVFTSGGTEALHLAMNGVARGMPPRHVITSEIEHPAIAATLDAWQKNGTRVTRLKVLHGIPPDADALRNAVEPTTDLVVLQWVNHETGTLLPVHDYAAVCHENQIPLVVDGTQALGKVPVDAHALGAAALIIAGHKMGGPAGIGAVVIRKGVDLRPAVLGGAQERGRRAGTPDVVRAVGFGVACLHLPSRLATMPAVAALRSAMEAELVALGAVVNGAEGPRVATVANVSIQEKQGTLVVAAMDLEGVCLSSGAACSSGVAQASPVLRAMYPDQSWRADTALRLSFGPSNTRAEVDTALRKFALVLPRIPNLG
ncbi:MAG: cysteine desulfurase [Sandaracinaceae bacterium]|nr:cysteine desulfurase [Sandaracinaceae bacterium]